MYVSKIPRMPQGHNKFRPGEVFFSVSGVGEIDGEGEEMMFVGCIPSAEPLLAFLGALGPGGCKEAPG